MKKQFLVALHVQSISQVLAQAELLLDKGGADGLLLVNNGATIRSGRMDVPNLFDVTKKIRDKFPNFVIGINPLDLSTLAAVELATEHQIDVLWVDNGGAEEKEGKAFIPEALLAALKNFPGKYYGGTAFKYQALPQNMENVCTLAAQYFDVVVTSGTATGVPARTNKIKRMKSFIGADKPFALASGLTEENLEIFYEYVDVFIVGTFLQTSPADMYHYDVAKVRDFKNALMACKNKTRESNSRIFL